MFFDDLPENEHVTLCETFRVWQDNDASVREVAEVLFCRPNTVRHRLRRIERLTGRSLSRPKDVAELCSASEVRRRLMAVSRRGRPPPGNALRIQRRLQRHHLAVLGLGDFETILLHD